MIIDARTAIAVNYNAARSVGTHVLPDVVDLGANAPRQPGPGENVGVLIQVTTALAGSGANVEFQLVSSDDSTLGSGVVVHDSTGAQAVSFWNAGRMVIKFLPADQPMRRYLGMRMIVSGAATTAGVIQVHLVHTPYTFTSFQAVV